MNYGLCYVSNLGGDECYVVIKRENCDKQPQAAIPSFKKICDQEERREERRRGFGLVWTCVTTQHLRERELEIGISLLLFGIGKDKMELNLNHYRSTIY